jgi:GNAT superfamily N-acetyltransferase
MQSPFISIREANIYDYAHIGKLTVEAYSSLPGMPNANQIPDYYMQLASVEVRACEPSVEIFIAENEEGELLGAVTFIGDVKYYGSGGSVSTLNNCCGFRLLAVSQSARRRGVGLALSKHCIKIAKGSAREYLIIHTTKSMKVAWQMYERLGFERFPEIDFMQESLAVFGFRLALEK